MKTEASVNPYQEQTLYELLEVEATASLQEIREAYERAAELYAPDSVAIYALEDPGQAEELRTRLALALKMLTDSERRDEYDRSIGLIPPLPDEEEEESPHREPSQMAMNEVLASAEAVHSTHPEFSVSYVPPSDREAKPAVEARQEVEVVEPVPAAEVSRAPEPVEIPAPPAPEPVVAPVAEVTPPRRPADPPPPAEVREVRAPKALDLPPDAEFNGELLRRAREIRGLTLHQVADRTRISARHLDNIEADRYADLVAPVYLRGMLMNMAREYGLDPLRVAKSYLALCSTKKS